MKKTKKTKSEITEEQIRKLAEKAGYRFVIDKKAAQKSPSQLNKETTIITETGRIIKVNV